MFIHGQHSGADPRHAHGKEPGTISKPQKILLYGAGLWWLGAGLFGPLFAVFTERVGGGVLDISRLGATYLLVLGIFVFITGKVSDVIGKEKLMIWGYSLHALFTFSYLLVSAPWHIYAVQIGLGIAGALSEPTWRSLYAKYENKKHDGYAWGVVGMEHYFITAGSLVVGGMIVEFVSFDALFILMGVILTLAAIVQARIYKYSGDRSPR